MNVRVLLSWVLVAMLGSLPVAAKLSSKSKLRKVKEGIGNCVFATQPLPFEKESKYKGVKTSFKTGETVYARCYWPRQLKEYAEFGQENELRQKKGKYRVSLKVSPVGSAKSRKATRKKAKRKKKAKANDKEAPPEDEVLSVVEVISIVRAAGAEEWDQRDYPLEPNARKCLFASQSGLAKCMHLDAVAFQEAGLLNKTAPFTAQVCLKTYVESQEKDKRGKLLDPDQNVISEGCFEYTVTELPRPVLPPAGEPE